MSNLTNIDVYMTVVENKGQLQDEYGGKAGPNTLEYGNTLTIHAGSGFKGNTAFTKIEIFDWVDGAKGPSVGSWTGTTTDVGVLNIKAMGSTIVIKDNDRGANDADYGYSATIRDTVGDSHTDYFADPELMAKRRRGGGSSRDATPMATKQRPPEAGA